MELKDKQMEQLGRLKAEGTEKAAVLRLEFKY